MNKYKKDGKVAVLISDGFGAGWSTWADEDQREVALFDSRLVQAAIDGVQDIGPIANEIFGEDYFYLGGWKNIRVYWLEEGTRFTVTEYDGAETLRLVDGLTIVA